MNATDEEYFQIVLDAIRVCAHYKPRFGPETVARVRELVYDGQT